MSNPAGHEVNATGVNTHIYHIPERMDILKKLNKSKCGVLVGGKGTLTPCLWECNLVQSLWKSIW